MGDSRNIFTKPEYFRKKVEKDGIILEYLLQMPRLKDYKGYDKNSGVKYPVILFLHGSGGDEYIEEMMTGQKEGLLQDHVAPDYDFPFIVIGPKLPVSQLRAAAAPDKKRISWKDVSGHIIEALDQVIGEFPVDTDRIYLGGFSMGGAGTWAVGTSYPDRFAALVPAAGAGNPDELYKIKHLPIWVFHSYRDEAVPFAEGKKMVDKLYELGANVNFTIYPGRHSLKDTIFAEGTFNWLLRQNRSKNIL